MNFLDIAKERYSCRKYDSKRTVEKEKLDAILATASLAPSACNGQPYHLTICTGDTAKEVAKSTKALKINTFVEHAPVLIVISEEPYCKMAALGAKIKHNDYRSIDIGIVAAYITAQATEEGLGSCIIGWLDSEKIESICGIKGTVRLVISIGYPLDQPGEKKRKALEDMVSFK